MYIRTYIVMETQRCKVHPDSLPTLLVNPEGSYHYGKMVCKKCGKFISHAKKPKTVEALTSRRKNIIRWLHSWKRGELDIDPEVLTQLYGPNHLGLVLSQKYDQLLLLETDTDSRRCPSSIYHQ